MKWFSAFTVINSTVFPYIFSALKSWILSPIGTYVSTVPCSNSNGVLIFLNIEQGTLFGEQFRILPEIAVSSRNRVVWISPVTFFTITGYITDTRMRYGGSENIVLSLQVLSHESTVRSTDTSNLFRIHKRVCFAEQFRSFYNIIRSPFSPSIDVVCGKLLTEGDSAAGLDDIYYVITWCEQLGAVWMPIPRVVGVVPP